MDKLEKGPKEIFSPEIQKVKRIYNFYLIKCLQIENR